MNEHDTRTTLRLKRINQKGLEVATKLAELMADKDVTLADFEGGVVLGRADKEIRLRAFLTRINAARQRLLSGTYGVCEYCTTPHSEAALDEQPWLDRCSSCERGS